MSICILLARQRSGTGALGSVIDQHAEVDYFGEVFHDNEFGKPRNYFTFLKARIDEDGTRGLPMAARRNFDEYLAHAETLGAKTWKCLDVKYRSTHHFNGVWSGGLDEPALLRWAREREIPVLHLTRRNALKTYISGLLADANKVWHATAKDELPVKTVRLDAGRVIGHLNAVGRETALFFEHLQRHAAVSTIDYDELLDAEGLLTRRAEAEIRRVLPISEFTARRPAFVKQTDDRLWKVIENFQEIADALAPTAHGWMPYA